MQDETIPRVHTAREAVDVDRRIIAMDFSIRKYEADAEIARSEHKPRDFFHSPAVSTILRDAGKVYDFITGKAAEQ